MYAYEKQEESVSFIFLSPAFDKCGVGGFYLIFSLSKKWVNLYGMRGVCV